MFKVTILDCKYEVKNKTTKVVIKGRLNIPTDLYYIPFNILNWMQHFSGVSYNQVTDVLTVSAKVVCNKDDKFDALLGERLAESKAKSNLYLYMAVFCNKLLSYYCKLVIGNDVAYSIFLRENTSTKYLLGTYKRYHRLYIKELNHFDKLLEDVR